MRNIRNGDACARCGKNRRDHYQVQAVKLRDYAPDEAVTLDVCETSLYKYAETNPAEKNGYGDLT